MSIASMLMGSIMMEDRQVAVIIGGIEAEGANMGVKEVEVYTKDLGYSCADQVLLPNIPVALEYPSALFIENAGIVVCGGYNLDQKRDSDQCYILNNPHANWTENPSRSFQMPEMTLYPYAESFRIWMLERQGAKTLSWYRNLTSTEWDGGYNISNLSTIFCASSVTVQSGSNGPKEDYLIVGGDSNKHAADGHRAYRYCQVKGGINCLDNGDWISIDKSHDKLVNQTCTVYTDADHGQTLLVLGEDTNYNHERKVKAQIFYIEEFLLGSYHKSSDNCEGIPQGNDEEYKLPQSILGGTLITPNGKPVLFGGLEDEKKVFGSSIGKKKVR